MLIIDWKKYNVPFGVVSLRKVIEIKSKILKKNYIEYINIIRETKIRQSNIVNLTSLFKNYDLWTPGLIEEKSFYNSDELNDGIFVLAIEYILKKHKTQKVKIINFDINKKYLLSIFNKNKYIDLKIDYDDLSFKDSKNSHLRKFYHNLPFLFQSIIQIAFLSRNLFLKNILDKKFNLKNVYDIFFSSSYYFNVTSDKEGIDKRLIGSIPKKFSKNKNKIFLSNYHKGKTSIYKLNNYFNINSINNNQYIIINSLFNTNHFFKVIYYYFKILFSFKIIYLKKKIFSSSKLKNISPIFENSWRKTLYGPIAVKNIYLILIIDDFLKKFKKLNKAFFIYENQGWDKIFRKSWTNYNHGELNGVINSAIRFWDLRYAFQNPKFDFPDKIIINKKFIDQNFLKPNRFIKTKNIFYNNKNIKKNIKKKNIKNSLVIYGDIVDKTNYCFFNEINLNHKKFKKITFYYKPHPASKLDTNSFGNIKIRTLSSKNVNKVYSNKLISLGATSSVIELKRKNNKVAVYVPPSSLDFSPTFMKRKFKKIYSFENLDEFLKN